MLSQIDRQACAAGLLEAERSRTPVPRLTDRYPGMEIDDAYEIQRLLIADKLRCGARVVGHKIGLTSRAMQQAVGIDEPDFGHLLDTMVLSTHGPVDARRFLLPRVELELAFVLGRDLDVEAPSPTDVLSATEYVQPALEIIDSRTVIPRTVRDTIADNAACGAIVLGGRPVRPMDVDLRWVAAVLYRNGAIEESGVSCAVLGHPATAVAWLATRLARFGTVLRRGQVVLAGSFTRPVEIRPGDAFVADYGPLGLIPLTFAKD